MWTYEQLPKVQTKSTTFPIVCHNICFLWNILGKWSPTSTFVGCFGITANSMASVVKAEKERVWSLYSYCLGGWILEHIPGQAVYTAGMAVGLSLSTRHPTDQWTVFKAWAWDRSIDPFIHSINYSCTSTMCKGSHPAQAWVWWLSKPENKSWPEALACGQLESSRDSDGVQRG